VPRPCAPRPRAPRPVTPRPRAPRPRAPRPRAPTAMRARPSPTATRGALRPLRAAHRAP
jgi:hypothetical protein